MTEASGEPFDRAVREAQDVLQAARCEGRDMLAEVSSDLDPPGPRVGLLVREEHDNDPAWPGSSVWLRIARWVPLEGPVFGWLCVQSDAPGNVLLEITDSVARLYHNVLFSDMPVIGAIPGSPAAEAGDAPT